LGNQDPGSEPVITLPKGGGALHGIGEKFSPDLFTGTGNFTIPISLPPGRNGFQPQLNLVYSTGNGNGFFGLGWRLSAPGVMRKTLGCAHAQPKKSAVPIFRRMLASHERSLVAARGHSEPAGQIASREIEIVRIKGALQRAEELSDDVAAAIERVL